NFQGRGSSMVSTKLRDIESGSGANPRFGTSDKIEDIHLERKNMEYLYSTGDAYIFMDNESFEQIELTKDILGDAMDYLIENSIIQIQFYQGNAVGIELPITVNLEVTYTEPGLKNATVTTSFKPATLQTGLEVGVPPFIENGEIIKVDTRTGKYIERVKNS
ncbi:MAG: elongation factor P, partial [Candidatus Muirbacterium halophilum]|nr:elongation factor P [Candidatus Muirbacterium halophilum]